MNIKTPRRTNLQSYNLNEELERIENCLMLVQPRLMQCHSCGAWMYDSMERCGFCKKKRS